MATVPRYWPGSDEFTAIAEKDPGAGYDAAVEALLWADAMGKDKPVLDSLEQVVTYYRMEASAADFEWDMCHNLWLPDKDENLVLMKPVPLQEKLNEYAKMKAADVKPSHPHGDPIQLLGPKSRRHGFSQWVAAWIFIMVRNTPFAKALVLCQSGEEAADQIFEKYTLFWEMDFGVWRPPKQRLNTKELKFLPPHHGQIRIATAGIQERGTAHGTGNKYVHASEESRYSHVNPGELLSGIFATMPGPDEAMTAVFRETTGFGMRGPFYEDCKEVLDGVRSGAYRHERIMRNSSFWYCAEHGWDMVFASSLDRYDATMKFDTPYHRKKFREGLSEKELGYLKKYKCSLEWLNWRRYTYEKETKGSVTVADRERKMLELHPLEIMDCFQATGDAVYSGDTIREIRLLMLREPVFEGDIKTEIDLVTGGLTETYVTPVGDMRKRAGGPLVAYEDPIHGHEYMMGIDLSEGKSVKNDASAVYCINRTLRTVAFRYVTKKMPPHHFIVPVRLLSQRYNDSMMLAETNFFADFTRWLMECDRKDMLVLRENPTGTDVTENVHMVAGYRTTPATKRQMVGAVDRAADMEPTLLADDMILEQMEIFQEHRSPGGQVAYVGAKGKNENDDVHDAGALALIGDKWAPSYRGLPTADEHEPKLPPLSTDGPQGHRARQLAAMHIEAAQPEDDGSVAWTTWFNRVQKEWNDARSRIPF